ncbi:CBN-SRV-4 protein [Caenorhabditis brenneri]|uniref:CBN-SRV-4 protein n=1 Tax=Caenorhabditis brenneri TaxID=135651 RepID=G0N0V0_CAEBE|nr:CBN-SRV-4 protein [Caenorhabditis brenneri]
MRANADFMKVDALQDIVISTFCFLISSLLYAVTFIHLIQQLPKTMNTPYFTSRKRYSNLNTPTDLIIFKCAFFSFVLFTPNFAKTIVLYFATNPTLIDIGTELCSPWSLLLSSSKLREEFLPEKWV